MKIRINVLSAATSVKGQGVGSAYSEQLALIKESEAFDISINSYKGDADIYHIHTVNLGYRLRMNHRHINVVYVHFIPSHNDGSIKLWKPIDYIFRKYSEGLYKKADELVVVNPYFISDLEKLGIDKDRITYIPNFVSKDNFFKIDNQLIVDTKIKYHIPLDKFVVLGCGQIQTRKGFDDFVNTAKENPEMFFVWVGGFSFGKITDGYSKYKKLLQNLPQNMINIPIIDRELMNNIFNCIDVLFMPSYLELFPMTILEVANISKPILLRDLELYKPILSDKYLVGNDPKSFGDQLKKLQTNPSYYKEYSKRSEEISNIYNKEYISKLWVEYYERIYQKWNKKKLANKIQ